MPILTSNRQRRAWTLIGQALVFALLAVMPLAGPPQYAQAQGRLARESDLKAVFIYNFAQFVEWPATPVADDKSPFVIAVIGNDPVFESLRQITLNESINGRRIEVRQYHDPREIVDCHILFVSGSESPREERILAATRGKAILTVGETDGFSKRNGMIQFFMAGQKLRLRINPEAARAENLTISSKLLRQAEIVPSP